MIHPTAESYHSKLKSIVKTHRSRIWTFMTAINNTIEDVDNDICRLRFGREICRPRKKVFVKTEEQRRTCKEKLRRTHESIRIRQCYKPHNW